MRSASPAHPISSAPAIRSAELTPIGAGNFRSRFKLPASIIALSIGFSLLFGSCDAPEQKNTATDSNTAAGSGTASLPGIKTPIGNTGFTITLPSGYRIKEQKTPDGIAYYFAAIDSIANPGEGGIYIGPEPDKHEPSREHSKREMPGIFLGQTVTWIEYRTDQYIQRETFYDEGNGQQIHCWCYSANEAELELLFKMVNSVNR